jgi:hypothetical protein
MYHVLTKEMDTLKALTKTIDIFSSTIILNREVTDTRDINFITEKLDNPELKNRKVESCMFSFFEDGSALIFTKTKDSLILLGFDIEPQPVSVRRFLAKIIVEGIIND